MRSLIWALCICGIVAMVLRFIAQHLLPFIERRKSTLDETLASLRQHNYDLTIRTYHRIEDRYYSVVQALTHIQLAIDMQTRELSVIKDKLPRMARTRATDRNIS